MPQHEVSMQYQGGRPCKQPAETKTEAVARRVVAILEEILQGTNHGEIVVRVTNGAVEVAGGPRYRIT